MLLNRKLIIAVLTIGLMLSFSSAAIGYDDNQLKIGEPLITSNPNAPFAGQNLETYRNIPDFQKSVVLTPITAVFDNSTPERECEYLSYNDGVAWFWGLPDSYGDCKFATRFTPIY